MPNRIIREGLLDSQRYWSVSIEARQLFLHLMLLADDFGLVSLAPVFIRRRCFDDAPSQAKIDKLRSSCRTRTCSEFTRRKAPDTDLSRDLVSV